MNENETNKIKVIKSNGEISYVEESKNETISIAKVVIFSFIFVVILFLILYNSYSDFFDYYDFYDYLYYKNYFYLSDLVSLLIFFSLYFFFNKFIFKLYYQTKNYSLYKLPVEWNKINEKQWKGKTTVAFSNGEKLKPFVTLSRKCENKDFNFLLNSQNHKEWIMVFDHNKYVSKEKNSNGILYMLSKIPLYLFPLFVIFMILYNNFNIFYEPTETNILEINYVNENEANIKILLDDEIIYNYEYIKILNKNDINETTNIKLYCNYGYCSPSKFNIINCFKQNITFNIGALITLIIMMTLLIIKKIKERNIC